MFIKYIFHKNQKWGLILKKFTSLSENEILKYLLNWVSLEPNWISEFKSIYRIENYWNLTKIKKTLFLYNNEVYSKKKIYFGP